MAQARLGRFTFQLRLTLVLLVLFLAAADLVNLVLLGRARDALEVAESERVRSRGREVARALGADAPDPRRLARTARDFDLRRLAVFEPEGRVIAAWPEPGSFWPEIDADARAALAAGRVVSMRGPTEAPDGVLAIVPVLDSTGGWRRARAG